MGRRYHWSPSGRGSGAHRCARAGVTGRAGLPRPHGGSAGGGVRRIPRAMTTATPSPSSTSPTLNTLANGHPGRQGEDVGQRRPAPDRPAPPSSRSRRPDPCPRRPGRPRGRHHAAVGHDGGQVGGGAEGHQGHARHGQVAQRRRRARPRSRARRWRSRPSPIDARRGPPRTGTSWTTQPGDGQPAPAEPDVAEPVQAAPSR